MPITFKNPAPTKVTIDKDGTLFHFEISESKRRQARINTYTLRNSERDAGAVIEDVFRKSLVGWENLIDEAGEQVPFSIDVRDKLVLDTDIFDDGNLLKVIEADGEKKTK